MGDLSLFSHFSRAIDGSGKVVRTVVERCNVSRCFLLNLACWHRAKYGRPTALWFRTQRISVQMDLSKGTLRSLRSIHRIICIFCMYIYIYIYIILLYMYIFIYIRYVYIYIYINTCIYHTYIQQQYMQYQCFYNILCYSLVLFSKNNITYWYILYICIYQLCL